MVESIHNRKTGPADQPHEKVFQAQCSAIDIKNKIDFDPLLFQKLKADQQEEIVDIVESAVSKSPRLKDAFYFRSASLTDLDQQFLLERHLISREHATEKGEKAVAGNIQYEFTGHRSCPSGSLLDWHLENVVIGTDDLVTHGHDSLDYHFSVARCGDNVNHIGLAGQHLCRGHLGCCG